MGGIVCSHFCSPSSYVYTSLIVQCSLFLFPPTVTSLPSILGPDQTIWQGVVIEWSTCLVMGHSSRQCTHYPHNHSIPLRSRLSSVKISSFLSLYTTVHINYFYAKFFWCHKGLCDPRAMHAHMLIVCMCLLSGYSLKLTISPLWYVYIIIVYFKNYHAAS